MSDKTLIISEKFFKDADPEYVGHVLIQKVQSGFTRFEIEAEPDPQDVLLTRTRRKLVT